MSKKKELEESLQALENLKHIAENYEEIAATRVQRIKAQVLGHRDYLSELSEVFVDLKSSYEKEVEELLERRGKEDKTLPQILQKNGKTLLVYMSSNGKLFGAVTKKTYRLFIEELKAEDKEKIEVIIIGSAGKQMYDAAEIDIPYEYIHLPDDNISIEDIKGLMERFLKYTKVVVYHGTFINVVSQNAISSSITGDDIFEKETAQSVPKEERFIFEPSFAEVFNFFETQIMSVLFRQTYSENRLARQASRVNAMEEALIHIQEEEEKLNHEKVRLKHLLENKKQIERMSGFILWDIA